MALSPGLPRAFLPCHGNGRVGSAAPRGGCVRHGDQHGCRRTGLSPPVGVRRVEGKAHGGAKGRIVSEPSTTLQPSVARQSLWAVSTQLLIVLISMVTSVLLNRTLGREGRGAVALVLFWPPLLAALGSAGW